MRKKLFIVIALLAAFGIGLAVGVQWEEPRGTFHDMIVNYPDDLQALVTPGDHRVKRLALALKTPENAYLYVRDKVLFDPSVPSGTAGEVIAEGRASCLGKAVLLASLYRAMGIPASDVRIVTGELAYPTGIIDHAWIDMEYKGACLQQDATNLLGRFAFDQFKGREYARTFARKEWYAFNDEEFVVVSQLNILQGLGHPPVP